MRVLPPKKPRKPKVAVREKPPAAPFFIELLGFVCIGLALCGLMAAFAGPAVAVGDNLRFGGQMPLPGAGASLVQAGVVRDVWGSEVKPCTLDLRALVRADANVQVAAINKDRMVVEWMAPGDAAAGCPAAPALLAVSPDDYAHMVAWRQAPTPRGQHRYAGPQN